MIILGSEVEDLVTGFRGIAVARHIYLNGCEHISVQPKLDKDGKVPDSYSCDWMQLKVLSAPVVEEGNRSTGGPGGPVPGPLKAPKR